jgi:acyl-CoA thioesterase
VTEHLFDTDTRVEARNEGDFMATVTDRWNALGGGPNGGYSLAICLQALRGVMPLPDPLVVSGFFLRPAVAGPAEVMTEVARSGRRTATGEARLVQKGKEIVRAVATFTDFERASGRTLVLNEPPRLPRPEECVDVLAGVSMPGLSIIDRIDYRMPVVPGWLKGESSNRPNMDFWMRFKDGRDADLMSLPMLVDAAAPVVLEIGEPGSFTMELTVHVRARPVGGWLACRVATRHVIGGYHEEDFEIWDSEGNLVAQSRQMAVLPSAQWSD